MLEKAVYARRNHTAILAAAAFAPFGLGTEIERVLPTADGGAWTVSSREVGRETVGRLDPAGRFTSVLALNDSHSAIGPDGQGWFADDDGVLYRGGGRLGTLPAHREGEARPIATGPDGTLWAPRHDLRTLTRVTADGRFTVTPLTPPRCARTPYLTVLTRAADGAMWFGDSGCQRVLRLAPDGTWRSAPGSYEAAHYLAPDLAGGAWVTGDGGADYITAAGERLHYSFDGGAHTVAVAPDGAAWISHGRCQLTRMEPDRSRTTGRPAPLPARQLAFAPDGRLWLTSLGRLTNGGLDGDAGCDDTPPRVTLPRRVSRTRGVTLTFSEPVRVNAFTREVSVQRRWRYRPPASALRGRTFRLSLIAEDIDGNRVNVDRTLRITR